MAKEAISTRRQPTTLVILNGHTSKQLLSISVYNHRFGLLSPLVKGASICKRVTAEDTHNGLSAE